MATTTTTPEVKVSTKIMRVKKRDGSYEPVNPEKITRRVVRAAANLHDVDANRIAQKTIEGLRDGSTTVELDLLAINNAANLILVEPQYSRLAARLLDVVISEEVSLQGVYSFSQSIHVGHNLGLISDRTAAFVAENAAELNEAIDESQTDLFEYFGLRTLYERYLIKHPKTRNTIETAQYFFMRIACGLADNIEDAVAFYKTIAAFDFMPSTPTLFNSGTTRPQMSSCFLLDSPEDNLESIYKRYWEIAALSKYSGGIGVAYHRIRSQGSHIKGTNGHSNGIIPWLKTLDSSIAAVNQGGKRKGAACVYLETWHPDIEEFLELKDSTGDTNRRIRQLNTANWVPDLFMKRVEEDGLWSLFDPKVMPQLTDLYGDEFEKEYTEAENKHLFEKQIKARELFGKMMRTLAETGNGWMTFKDSSNKKSNQTGKPGNVVHSSNLCTEIIEVTSENEIAVCNLGSINLGMHVVDGKFDFQKLAETTLRVVPFMDRVIDRNMYTVEKGKDSNMRWRPIGLGLMGLQDVFFKLGLAFDSPEALELSTLIQDEIYYNALIASSDLAEQLEPAPAFKETKTADGILSFDLWEEKAKGTERYEKLRERIKQVGLRNTLLIAIAPTATIASITGTYEATEPQTSNIFKRETMSGEFAQINKYLVKDLKKLDLWNVHIRDKIKVGEGSIQQIEEIPAEVRNVYRTVWEVPMKAIIDLAAARSPFIDQSQSLNLFAESPNITKLSSMYMYAWKKGIKTTYYLRSRPATTISKVTVQMDIAGDSEPVVAVQTKTPFVETAEIPVQEIPHIDSESPDAVPESKEVTEEIMDLSQIKTGEERELKSSRYICEACQ